MLKVHLNRNLGLIGGLLALDVSFFGATDPHRVTAVILIAGYLLLVATVYLSLDRLLALSAVYGLPFSRHRSRLGLFGTGVVASFAGLQSMGEFSNRDLLVVLPLAAMLYLYVAYGRTRATT